MKLNLINQKYEAKLKQIEKDGYGRIRMKYAKTKGTFSASHCGLDLVNETGHSYGWWNMFKRIKGRLILNSYRYSPATGGHISKASSVLHALRIKYISIEAPKGLQDLESARLRAAELMGNAIVLNKYARSPNKWATNHAETNLKNLRTIGITVPQKLIKAATEQAEQARTRKLERLKEKRLRAKEQLATAQTHKHLDALQIDNLNRAARGELIGE